MAKVKEGGPFYPGSKHVALHASLSPADQDLLEWIADFFGCNRSEAVRTALRMTVATLTQVRSQE